MPERLIGAVLKTVERASVPWVRIPPSPPFKRNPKGFFFCTSKLIMNEEEIIKLQIDLYQKHFLNFVTAFESDNAPKSKIIAFELNNYNS